MKTAKKIFRQYYERKTGKPCDDTIFEHMKYCIKAMEEYRGQPVFTIIDDEDRIVKICSSRKNAHQELDILKDQHRSSNFYVDINILS